MRAIGTNHITASDASRLISNMNIVTALSVLDIDTKPACLLYLPSGETLLVRASSMAEIYILNEGKGDKWVRMSV